MVVHKFERSGRQNTGCFVLCFFFFQVYCGSEIRCGIIILCFYLLSPVRNLNLNSYAEELGIAKVGINRALKF